LFKELIIIMIVYLLILTLEGPEGRCFGFDGADGGSSPWLVDGIFAAGSLMLVSLAQLVAPPGSPTSASCF